MSWLRRRLLACRFRRKPTLDNLAERIEPTANWEDLALPEASLKTLREIVAQVRERSQAHEEWDVAQAEEGRPGLCALFSGPSGPDKSIAAELVAKELDFSLYRIDLGMVVSKYIGETEKNLRRVFDAAESGGALLFFDEADDLFGRRTEVEDSHDRYANAEVDYLLAQVEEYRGIAILAASTSEPVDKDVRCRIRYVVEFDAESAES